MRKDHNLIEATLASPRGAALLCTNHVYTDINQNPMMIKYLGSKATDTNYGGNAVLYNIDHQIHLYTQGGKKKARIADSSSLPHVEVAYDLDPDGGGFVEV